YDYVYTSHIYTTALVGMLKSLGIIRSTYFVARESTSIFLRFKGFMLRFYSFLYKIGYRKIDLLICQTEEMKNQLLEHFPNIRKRTKIKVIPNPIDLGGKSELANQDLDDIFKVNCLVSAGRLIELKGYNFLIEAFEQLKKEHPKLKLVILGRGPLKEVIEQQVDTSIYKNDIFMQGRVDNVYNYFKHAQVCVVSSLIEGFPNVLLQMMSQNDKVVSTLCAGGIDEIDGIYTAEPGNTEALAKAIHLALTEDTSGNRKRFDDYLDQRSIERFVQQLNAELINA
ncbi:MAG: glycosyltransferase, partial [Bacteroidia bacterium]|nr:glycosyltransferase [Bacteroidia bacterium]